MYGFSFVQTLPLRFARFVRDNSWSLARDIEVVEGEVSSKIVGLFDVPVEVVGSRRANRVDQQRTPCVIFSFVGRQRRQSTFETYDDIITLSALVLAADDGVDSCNVVDTIIDLLESFFLSLVEDGYTDAEYRPHVVNISEWDLSSEPTMTRNLVAAGLIVEIVFSSTRHNRIFD